MKISVIMAVYNGELYIKDAIESILNQTYQDFEFIIIDDGSKDNSLDIIKNYARKDKKIIIIQNKINIGLTRSLNKGIKKAQGTFIARQDVDDISVPRRLELQIKFFQNNPDHAFCGSDILIKQNKEFMLKFFDLSEIRKNLIAENCFTHSTILIRKKFFKLYGLYDEKYLYGQDYELWCRLIYKYHLKAKNLREKLVIMNIPRESLSQKNIKFLIQSKNSIKTKLENLRYTDEKIKCILSILNKGIRIFYVLFSKLI